MGPGPPAVAPMLDACYNHGVKILIGTAGGAGSDKHVDALYEIVRDMAAKRKYEFRVATIKSNISRTVIHQRFKQGRISPCGPVPPLEVDEIDMADEVVAQMGPEPFVKALQSDPDIIIVSEIFTESHSRPGLALTHEGRGAVHTILHHLSHTAFIGSGRVSTPSRGTWGKS
jgi:hypothetical protein